MYTAVEGRGQASVGNVNPDHMWDGATLTSDKNMSAALSRQQLEKFEKDGILIIEDFLTKDEVSSIRNVFKHDVQTILLLFVQQWLVSVSPCSWGSDHV